MDTEEKSTLKKRFWLNSAELRLDNEKSVFDEKYKDIAPLYSISPKKYMSLNHWLDASHFNDTGSLEVAKEIEKILKTELCLPGN